MGYTNLGAEAAKASRTEIAHSTTDQKTRVSLFRFLFGFEIHSRPLRNTP